MFAFPAHLCSVVDVDVVVDDVVDVLVLVLVVVV